MKRLEKLAREIKRQRQSKESSPCSCGIIGHEGQFLITLTLLSDDYKLLEDSVNMALKIRKLVERI